MAGGLTDFTGKPLPPGYTVGEKMGVPAAASAQAPEGNAISRGYHAIAEPATRAMTHVAADIGEQVSHPEWSLGQGIQAIEQNYYTPAEKLPPLAREVAEFIVPQTVTGAAIQAGLGFMPEAGIARELGEAAGPVASAVGTRLGRIGAGTAIGAAGGAISGEGAGKGALQGAASMLPMETLGAVGGWAGKHMGEGSLIRDTTAKFGKAISDRMPWVGKISKGSEFASAFIHDGAVDSAGRVLERVKNDIGARTKGVPFMVPVPGPNGYQNQAMDFLAADKLITDIQKGHGYTIQGAEKGGATPREARALAFQIRDQLAADLNKFKPGLGDDYLRKRKMFDASMTMTKIFKKDDLIGPQGLNQSELIGRLDKYSHDLERSLGKGAAKDLLGVLRRGFVGQGKDYEAAKGGVHAGMHIPFTPFHVYSSRAGAGGKFNPIGEVPGYMRPNMGKVEAGINAEISRLRKPEDTPTKKTDFHRGLATKRAEAIAGPHATKERIGSIKKVSKKIEAGTTGKPPDLTNKLKHGVVSLENVRDMMDMHGGATDVASVFKGVSAQDAIGLLAKASENEKAMLLPAVAQKINDEGKGKPPQAQQQLMAALRAAMREGVEGELG